MRTLIATIVLAIAVPLVHSQQPSKPARTAQQPAATKPGASAEDAQARQDLQRMKALVQQMQTNLAFVSSSQDPLKHQFELEIEMWQIEIARTQRRLNSSAEKE
jgi:hypothetical protein